MSKKINKSTKKNINIDNTNTDTSENTDNLSEELNKLSTFDYKKNDNNEIKQVDKIITLTPEENLENIYFQLYNLLNKSDCKILNGEIISFRPSDTNAYLTIKIGSFQISCIFWNISKSKNIALYKSFKDGDKIKIEGNFSILKKNLSIYFNLKTMEKIGIGDYLSLHNEYRNKIIELGLNQNKQILNKFPCSIGIVTSIEGAAIQDILQTFKIDNYIGNIIIVNAVVQGKSCPQSVISGIKYIEFNHPNADLILITRGGGSYEDLVGFSDWELVKYIANTKIITISAVGHQIDNQLSDEVADYKFATPSIAAKFIIEKQKEYIEKYKNFKNYINFISQKYKKSIIEYNQITNNYNNIIDNFNIGEIKDKLYKYSNIVKNTIYQYNNAKKNYYNMAVNLKPTILIKSKEINSIYDIINSKSKKMEIILPDGIIKISFKIEEPN